jgi:putative transposase
MVGVPARRRGVAYAEDKGVSARRACTLLGISRSALRYESKLAVKDADVTARMKGLARQYPRYGYRRIRIFLAREGFAMSAKRAWRLWRLAGCQLPRRRPRKRVAASRPRPAPPAGPNHVWSYDFVFDTCAGGQQLKCLTVTDEWTKEGLAIDVAGSIRSRRVIEVLARLVSERGAPKHLRSDNGPEFVSRAILQWICDQGISTALIDPGKPWQNGVIESFNGKFRDECLGMEWFRSRAEAKVVIEKWRKDYNSIRPHSSLDYMTPAEFAAKCARGEVEIHPSQRSKRPAMGRSAAICGVSAARPIAPSQQVCTIGSSA